MKRNQKKNCVLVSFNLKLALVLKRQIKMRSLYFYIILILGLSLTSLGLANLSNDCKIGDRVIGFSNGISNIDWNSLVSKMPSQKLSPLAIPSPLQRLPVDRLNPLHQDYYRKIGSLEFLREDAAIRLLQMITSSEKDGVLIYIHSAYRSYQTQCEVFKKKVSDYIKKSGQDIESAIHYINTKSAFPGESEHQLGTTIDLVTDIPQIGYKLEYEFAQTRAYQWLKSHAHEYGFVLSFPLGAGISMHEPHPRTGIIFEPWHWRYIGTQHAQLFYDCHEEYTIQEFLRKLQAEPNFRCRSDF